MIYGEWFYIFIYVRVLKLYLMNIVDHIYIYETVDGQLHRTIRSAQYTNKNIIQLKFFKKEIETCLTVLKCHKQLHS